MVDAKGGMKIKVTRGGPYLVTGNISMSKQIIITDKKKNSLGWEEGTHYPVPVAKSSNTLPLWKIRKQAFL